MKTAAHSVLKTAQIARPAGLGLAVWVAIALLPLLVAAAGVGAMLLPGNGWSLATTGLAVALVALALLFAGLLQLLISRPLRQLAQDAAAISNFRFDQPVRHSSVREIATLAGAQQRLQATLGKFLEISRQLSAEHSFTRMLNRVGLEILDASGLQASVIYVRQGCGGLRPVAWRDAEERPALPKPVQLTGNLAVDHPLRCAADGGCPARALILPALPPAGLDWLTAWFPGRPVRLLAIPLRNRGGDLIGLLGLAAPGEAAEFPPELEAFVSALSGVIAVAVDQQHLSEEQVRLFDGLVRLVAQAIDTRSPHTGAHCQRVPRLAEALAETMAADGHLVLDETSQEVLRLAAWLHDCGKMAVPDLVVEKATRLTTVYDRIHEIRVRFEVLKRDAELNYWRQGATAAGREALLQRWQDLDEDFAFVAACNQGSGPLPPAARARLRQIGRQVWLRSLDDRLGISREELARKGRVPPRSLPAKEHLLADRLEHLVDWLPGEPMSQPLVQPSVGGQQTPPPRHKLNLGELYNLTCAGGTLTPEERHLMDAHAGRTLAMLTELPWPRHLSQVPAIAGAHHEHPDGSGHPRGLRGEAIPLLARVLAVADVFEALSANDRPYKPPQPLTRCLAMLVDMALAGQLDATVVRAFLVGQVWRRCGPVGTDDDRTAADCAAVQLARLAGTQRTGADSETSG
jgi:HD-GYP domain-containing protein (c-di-GMP phosphodiesterase class II)